MIYNISIYENVNNILKLIKKISFTVYNIFLIVVSQIKKISNHVYLFLTNLALMLLL